MRRILITGASGFVGQYVAAAFLRSFAPAAEVYGLVRRAQPAMASDEVRYITADLTDGRAVSEILSTIRPTDIFHLAALSSVSGAAAHPVVAWKENVTGLLNIADAATKYIPGVNFYFISSGEVYGRSFLSGTPLAESAPILPIGTYASTKSVGEQILIDLSLAKPDFHLVILRPFNHIGPGQNERFVVASFAAQIARIEAKLIPPVIEVGNLSVQRDFLDVRDVTDAYTRIVSAISSLEARSIYNICSGQPRSIASILSTLASMSTATFEIKVTQDRFRPSDILIACGDASSVGRKVGWKPQQRLEDTLASMLDYARARLRN